MASMRDWLKGLDAPEDRVVVVHCKAGKGRSGTAACSYLISEEGWSVDDALMRFTARRMRSGFGAGVSIPSQLRYIGYVDKWTKHGKIYVESQVEVLEVHVWGLRQGVKVGINGFIDEGKTIKIFHVFGKHERMVVDGQAQADGEAKLAGSDENALPIQEAMPKSDANSRTQSSLSNVDQMGSEIGGGAVIFRPSSRIILPSNDIDIDFERRNKAAYGWTMVTSIAHVWFNTFFEGHGPENHGNATADGVFEIDWDDMDGIKGSVRKGVRALDRLALVWRTIDAKAGGLTKIITEPKAGDQVPQTHAADWKGGHHAAMAALGKDLGLRTESPASRSVSKASSITSAKPTNQDDDPATGVRVHGPLGEQHIPLQPTDPNSPNFNNSSDSSGPAESPQLQTSPDSTLTREIGIAPTSSIIDSMKKSSIQDKDQVSSVQDLPTSQQHVLGQVVKETPSPPNS